MLFWTNKILVNGPTYITTKESSLMSNVAQLVTGLDFMQYIQGYLKVDSVCIMW